MHSDSAPFTPEISRHQKRSHVLTLPAAWSVLGPEREGQVWKPLPHRRAHRTCQIACNACPKVQRPKSFLDAISNSRPAVDHGVQLRELGRRKENGSRGKSKLEIGGGWLAEHVGGGDEVEQVVDELQGDVGEDNFVSKVVKPGRRCPGASRTGRHREPRRSLPDIEGVR